jgi:hypothetical protein
MATSIGSIVSYAARDVILRRPCCILMQCVHETLNDAQGSQEVIEPNIQKWISGMINQMNSEKEISLIQREQKQNKDKQKQGNSTGHGQHHPPKDEASAFCYPSFNIC